MKKVWLIVFLALFVITNVKAEEERKLYIKEKDNEIRYDSALLDQDTLIRYEDIVSQKEVVSQLLVENNTTKKRGIYMKAHLTDSNDELLKHIRIRVEVADKIVYEGSAKGIKYKIKNDSQSSDSEVELDDVVYIGSFDAKSTGRVVITAKLDGNYKKDDNVTSKINWDFYADGNLMVSKEANNTVKYIILFMMTGALVVTGVVYSLIVLIKR